MSSGLKYQQLKSHLPSLYQPEERDINLLNLLLKELGINMDQISRDLTVVMQAHWYKTADKASYDNHFIRARELAGLARVNLQNKDDKRAIADYPYLLDLARVGSLLSIPPWREPVALRETVEDYRKRLLRLVTIYRNGLGTLEAVRNMVTAELPENRELPLVAQQRSFSVEENIPFSGSIQEIQSIGLPLEKLGPLMRWDLSSSGSKSVAPVVFIEGIDDSDGDDATIAPMVERFDPDFGSGSGSGSDSRDGGVDANASLAGIGIAYTETVAPGATLKLSPAYSAFLVNENGIQRSSNSDTQVGIDGWRAVAGRPAGDVTASTQTIDTVMWFAIRNAGSHELWQYNGANWLQVLTTETFASIHCLVQRQQHLLLGSDDGLFAISLYPASGDPYAINEILAFTAKPVYGVFPCRKNAASVYVASAGGLDLLGSDNAIIQNIIENTPIRAVAENDTSLYFAGDLGVMQYRHKSRQTYYLSAEFESDLEDDWIAFEATATAATELNNREFGLPAVSCLSIGEEGSLWIGTAVGLARYRAKKEAESVYRNLVEGFGDLVDGPVTQIRKDEHGYMWFTTHRGLLRFDGRDLARFDFTENTWLQLGQADSRYKNDNRQERGLWRYNRTLSQWEVFDYTAAQWVSFTATASLAPEINTALHFVDSVKAELGTLTQSEFTKSGDVPQSQLRMRCKPDHTRIVDGGIPCVPRMPKGTSSWRYLSMEPEGLVDSNNLPWWSVEGRLVPPPGHDAPYPGRFSKLKQTPFLLGEMVFAYNPAAKIKFQWASNKPLRVMVRLLKRDSDDVIDPAIIDRVWKGISKVKPAGVQIQLAVADKTVRGEGS